MFLFMPRFKSESPFFDNFHATSLLYSPKSSSPLPHPPFLFIKVHEHLQLAESLKADLPVRWNCTKNNSAAMGRMLGKSSCFFQLKTFER
jgi:hypothetical protein